MSKEQNIELAIFSFKNISSWIEFADKKAGFFLTISLALFSASFALVPKASSNIQRYFSKGTIGWVVLAILLIMLFAVYSILAILGIRKLIKVVVPRLKPTTRRKSVLFYQTINDMELGDFKKEMQEMSAETIVDELADQIYNNAVVASEKYGNIGTSIILLKWSALFVILFLIIVSKQVLEKVLEKFYGIPIRDIKRSKGNV